MKAYCLMNHQLTEKQQNELAQKFLCEEIVYPDKELSVAWAQVSVAAKVDRELAMRVVVWLYSADKGDVLVVQGEIMLCKRGCFLFMLLQDALKVSHVMGKRLKSIMSFVTYASGLMSGGENRRLGLYLLIC